MGRKDKPPYFPALSSYMLLGFFIFNAFCTWKVITAGGSLPSTPGLGIFAFLAMMLNPVAAAVVLRPAVSVKDGDLIVRKLFAHRIIPLKSIAAVEMNEWEAWGCGDIFSAPMIGIELTLRDHDGNEEVEIIEPLSRWSFPWGENAVRNLLWWLRGVLEQVPIEQ